MNELPTVIGYIRDPQGGITIIILRKIPTSVGKMACRQQSNNNTTLKMDFGCW